jgi:hypothetical protein
MKYRVLATVLVLVLTVVVSLPAGGLASAMPADPPETTVLAPPPWGADAQGWTSGWVDINPGQTLTLTHNLGGAVEDYQVQLWFLDLPLGQGYGINIFGYGGIEAEGFHYGTYWQNLTPTTIEVVRGPVDGTADRVRVWIWKPSPAPDVCTDWLDATPGDFTQAVHQLGGDPEEYVISLWFKDGSGRIHQQGYGGLEDAGTPTGAYWADPTVSYIPVYRFPGDSFVDQVRVCVAIPDDPPAYDSGWWPIAPGTTLTLTHNVGGSVNGYIVDLEFYDVEAFGIHVVGLGGDFLDPPPPGDGADSIEHGAHWQNLTTSAIEVVRQDQDIYVDQVRVRIWQRKATVFLPLVLRGY